MAHAMDGCWAKVSRADETIKSLDAEITRFLNSDPKPYRILGSFYNSHCEFGFTGYGLPAPLRFPILIGEVVHHLRSCLDHLIWALASMNNGNASERIQFPICDSRAKFDKALSHGIVRGVGKAAIPILESLQPFTTKEPHDTILFVLHELDIEDKHKLPIVAVTAARIGKEIKIGYANGELSPQKKPTAITGMSLPNAVLLNEEGSRIFTVYFAEPSPEVDVQAEFDIAVSFAKLGLVPNVPVIQGLSGIRDGVIHTLKRFEPLFDA